MSGQAAHFLCGSAILSTGNKRARSRLIDARGLLGALALVAGVSDSAMAEAYPTRPVTMVVPYAAGGPTDTLARIIAEPMRRSLGQAVVIENVAGAAGSIATGRVAREKSDGYTVIIGNWGTHVLNGAMQALQYDLLGDFQPVSLIANNPLVIVSRKDVPASNLKEFIAWVQAEQAKLSSANSGAGSPSHISGLYFQSRTGTRFPFAAYRGAGPILQDLVSGKIDLFFDQVSNSLPQIQDQSIKAYAIAARSRSTAAPDIPTVDEAGLPGFYLSVWHALWAPKGTPNDVVGKLNTALVHALADPTVRKRLTDLGQEIVPNGQQTPAALATYQKAEIEKWWPFIKAEKLTAQ
jgi:tripartite-type tricarboxylate transporter receptor subunit TctC